MQNELVIMYIIQHKVQISIDIQLDSNQSVHPHTLVRVICYQPEETLDPWLPIQHHLKTDQTAWMCRLIRVFNGCTCHLVPLAEHRHNIIIDSCYS